MLEIITDKAREFRAGGMDWEDITARLVEDGAEVKLAEEATRIVRREKLTHARRTGMLFIISGAFLCLVSMVYTMVFGHNTVMLYGLTSVGVLIAFVGLIYVMG